MDTISPNEVNDFVLHLRDDISMSIVFSRHDRSMIPKKRHEHCFGNPSSVVKGGDALVGPKGGSFEEFIPDFTPFIIGVLLCV